MAARRGARLVNGGGKRSGLAALTRIEECDKNEGETEIREAYLARAEFYVRIGEDAKAHAALEETYAKTAAVGCASTCSSPSCASASSTT